jgi:ubiquitin C-terminal hydrolase
MMYGKFLTMLSCPKCGHIGQVYDPFLFLSVPMPDDCGPSVTLVELVRSFVDKDELDRDNMWMCPGCGKKVMAGRQTVICEAPQVFVFHFKRFTAQAGVIKKVTTVVDYPDKFAMSGMSKRATGTYKLLGVINHSGGISSGHYTAAAIDPLSGKWFLFNDSYVAPASEQNVHSTRAYMLFYQRID